MVNGIKKLKLIELPDSIKNSPFLNPTQLEQLATAGVDLPLVDPAFEDDMLKNIVQYYSLNPDEMEAEIHTYAATLLTEQKVNEAWQVLLTTI